MADTQFYRPTPPNSVAPPSLSRADLEARVAELERVVATLASLRDERYVERRNERPDPVALTAALHPRGRKSARNAKRRSSNDGTMAMRFVLFDPPAAR
jgi:hypothetical protein